MDYIESNYQDQQMFYDPAHPCNNILRIISEGILEILGIDINEIGEIDISVGGSEMPIYRCVREALGLKFAKEYIREDEHMDHQLRRLTPKMDLEEYVREYCYWCYGYIEK